MRGGEPPLGTDTTAELLESHLRNVSTHGLKGRNGPRHIGLAVSGGGDSVAMLWLVAPWAKAQGLSVSVATVDHGLRPEAGDEARFVEELCRAMAVSHDTLRWSGWDGRGNLQARAREARKALLGTWGKARGADAILLAHTEDDQAETVLLRLARGSGVDGLAGMAYDRTEDGLRWLRPLLGQSRTMLREYLRRHGRAWIEDPSNADPRFDRTKARNALAALEPLGITAGDLAHTAWRLSLAGEALRRHAVDAAERIATVTAGGDVTFDFDAFVQLPHETHLRLAAEAVRWVSGATYRPRLLSLQESLALSFGRPRTLGGTVLRRRPRKFGDSRFIVGREPRAASRADPVSTTDLWDGRWRLKGPHAPDLEVRMLGEQGIALCPDWRESGLERSSVLASPGVWHGETLVAAPLAGRAEGWSAEVATDFLSILRGGR